MHRLDSFETASKPIGIVTSSKSHGGKDTVVAFAAGSTDRVSVDYQSTDWAFRRDFGAALRACPKAGVVNVENARLGKGDRLIRSGFLERFLMDPEPVIPSPKGDALRIRNNLVITTSTNEGTVSEDLLNRGLPIHLDPAGNLHERETPIGNPKHEYLPANCGRIAAEFRGLVERWRAAGQPLDPTVRHPFTDWARTVGGIVAFNRYAHFLGNYSLRKTADDLLRKGLGVLGATKPDVWLRAADWARLAVFHGLKKIVIPEHDRDTNVSLTRGIGVVFSAHRDETFEAVTDEEQLTLRLEKKRARFGKAQPSTQYRFLVLERTPIPEDPPQDGDDDATT